MRPEPIAHRHQAGNVLFMILIAVVLLGALTYAMTGTKGDESATSITAGRISEDLKNQAQLIRSALLECTLVNNYGYPAVANAAVRDLKCKVGDTVEQDIFKNTLARSLPLPPSPFAEWQYANDGNNNIDISIATPPAKAGSANVKSALGRMSESFATDETVVVNDSNTASFTLHITKN